MKSTWWPPLLLIAHRGASEFLPENTIEAFRGAVEAGANMIELDVWKTRDGEVVVSHGGRVRGRKITTISFERARILKPNLCSLKEVVELVKRARIGIYVEIKDFNATEIVVSILREHNLEHQTVVGSFSKKTVTRLMRLREEGKTGVKVSWLVTPLSAGHIVQEGGRLGVDFIHPWHPFLPPMSDALVEDVHKKDMGVISGHTENPKQIQRLKNLGVDGICSNRPDLFQLMV